MNRKARKLQNKLDRLIPKMNKESLQMAADKLVIAYAIRKNCQR